MRFTSLSGPKNGWLAHSAAMRFTSLSGPKNGRGGGADPNENGASHDVTDNKRLKKLMLEHPTILLKTKDRLFDGFEHPTMLLKTINRHCHLTLGSSHTAKGRLEPSGPTIKKDTKKINPPNEVTNIESNRSLGSVAMLNPEGGLESMSSMGSRTQKIAGDGLADALE